MAMTLGSLNSSKVKIFFAGTAATCLVDATVSINMSTRDTTCHDSGDFEDALASVISWEMNGAGLFAFDATNGYDALFATILAKEKVAVAWGTAVAGDFKYGGNAFLTKLDGNASGNNANTQYSFSLKGVGAIAKTVNA